MAAPVGVPFPSGETPATTAAVWAAFAGATGTSMAPVTLASWHSAVEPAMSSGNVFNPHEIDVSDEPMTDVSAGMTWLHFEGRPASGLAASPFESSFIEAERSSTTNRSTGARFRSNESKPQLTSSGRSPLNFWSGSPASGSSTTTRPPVPGVPVVVAPYCGSPDGRRQNRGRNDNHPAHGHLTDAGLDRDRRLLLHLAGGGGLGGPLRK